MHNILRFYIAPLLMGFLGIPSLMAQDSVIVYRSKTEQIQDEFWAGVMQEHPEYFLILPGLFFLVIAAGLIWHWISILRHRRDMRRPPRSSWHRL